MKPKPPREVVLHHSMVPPPPDDWVLFPEEIIITNHSSVRSHDCGNPEKDCRSESPYQRRIRSERSKAKRGGFPHARHHMQRREEIPSAQCKQPDRFALTRASERGDVRTPPEPKFPERLSTPDISDVEEDGFWSCCGSSESSV